MPIYKAKVDSHFTTLPNDTVQNAALSFEARGLLALMLSMPHDWGMNREWIIKQSPNCGRDKAARIFKELEESGYLKRVNRRGSDGQIEGMDWFVYPTAVGKPDDGYADVDIPRTTKETDIQKKNNTNTSQSPGSTPPLFDEPSEPASQTCKLDTRENAVSLMQMWNDRADEYGTNWQRIDDPDDTSSIRYQRAKQRINQVRRRMEKKGVEPTLENILDWFDRFLHHMGDDPWYSGHPTDTNPKGYRLSFQQAFREDYFNDAIERLNQKQSG